MKFFEEIVNEVESNEKDILNNVAIQVEKLLGSILKKINKKNIKKDYEALRKFNVLQVAMNDIQDNFNI